MSNDEKIDLKIIDSITKKNMGKPGALMTILQEVQEELGFLPEIVLEKISDNTGIPASKIFGVVTFYSQFRFSPIGKNHIMVCRGTACHVLGSAIILQELEKHLKIKAGQTSRDGLFSIEVGDDSCNLQDFFASIDYFFTKNVGIGLAYKYINIDVVTFYIFYC
jgi:NADH-quinone oxidoreductase subunit E